LAGALYRTLERGEIKKNKEFVPMLLKKWR